MDMGSGGLRKFPLVAFFTLIYIPSFLLLEIGAWPKYMYSTIMVSSIARKTLFEHEPTFFELRTPPPNHTHFLKNPLMGPPWARVREHWSFDGHPGPSFLWKQMEN